VAIALNRNRWQKNEPKRLAVVLGGGGSLGAYEAGAVIELMYALDAFNAQLAAEGDREPFRLDVITGASAGGMTACILSRIMLYDFARRADLYRAWVQEIRMDGLLKENDDKNALDETNALLSKQLVRAIAARYLQQPPLDVAARATFSPDPSADPGSTDPRHRELLLALTLSNMDGFDYILGTRSLGPGPDRGYLTTRFSDMAVFAINGQSFKDLDWARVATSAVACGNFPIAFQPQTLARFKDDYLDGPEQLQSLMWPADLTYVDGGLFDNEPLGKAINLAGLHDPNGMPDHDRLFLMIHPNLTQSGHSNTIKWDSGILDQVKRLLSMLLKENAVSDWVRANKVNVLAGWKEEFVKSLSHIVTGTDLPAAESAELKESLLRLAGEIATAKKAGNDPDAKQYLKASVDDLRARYGQGLTGGKLDVFGLVLFILEHVSQLQRKEKLWLEVIGHHPSLALAGAQVSGFAGFFEEEWREYDYRRGRLDAWRALSGWGTPEETTPDWDESWWSGTTLVGEHDPARSILGVYDREPMAVQPTKALTKREKPQDSEYYTEIGYWRERTKVLSFPRVTFGDVPRELQEALVDRIVERIKQIFHLHGIGGWIIEKVASSKVDNALKGSGAGGRMPA
jgi:Patatin-like phospholipase